MKKSSLILVLFLSVLGLQAQADRAFDISVNVGLAAPILDGGIGGHIGVNPNYALSDYIGIEGQVSFTYISVESAFISGDKGRELNLFYLLGPRIYFNDSSKKWRPYIHLLAGGLSYGEGGNEDNDVENSDTEFGFSTGLYVSKNHQWQFGLAYESRGYVLAKLGYTF